MMVAAALGLGSIGSVANATEEPQYTVIQQHKGIEVRSYARLDAAIALAWTANQVTDEINTAPPRPKQR